MVNTKAVLFSIFALLVAFSSISCGLKREGVKDTDRLKAAGFERVTVVDSRDVYGCDFLLQRDDGSLLRPVNLDEEWKHAGIRLWVRVAALKGIVSVCMRGQSVKIIETSPEKK